MGHDPHDSEHTHAHEHSHTHEHTHADGTTHTHEHSHTHTHDHEHSHDAAPDKSGILLKYMIDHNAHHAEELLDLAKTLESEGRADAAASIRESVELFLAGNEKLAKIEL